MAQIYNNNYNTRAITYDQALEYVIEQGLTPVITAHLYLNAHEIRSRLGRQIDQNLSYGPSQKLAVYRGDKLVRSLDTCSHCHGLVIVEL